MSNRGGQIVAGCGVWILLLVLGNSPGAGAADTSSPPVKTPGVESVNGWIAGLSADSFRERVDAQKKLRRFAATQPQQLASLALKLEPEAQLRAVRLLEETFLGDDTAIGDAAEKGLEDIRRSTSIVSRDADMILIGNGRLREGRAREQIERLGGRLAYTIPLENRDSPTAPRIGVGFGAPALLQSILISEAWTGTPDDFWHFRRLSHHRNILLYNIRSNKLKLEDLMALSDDIPGLTVLERGASLGVRGGSGESAMIIGEVVANSAAAKADLRANDQILKLDEHEVRNFMQLVDLLLDYAPGQTVKLVVLRDRRILEIPVTLSSWRQMPLTNPPMELTPEKFPGPLGFGRPVPPDFPQRLSDDYRERFRLE